MLCRWVPSLLYLHGVWLRVTVVSVSSWVCHYTNGCHTSVWSIERYPSERDAMQQEWLEAVVGRAGGENVASEVKSNPVEVLMTATEVAREDGLVSDI